MAKLYINIDDNQGGSWFVGEVLTLKQWRELALEWCYLDDDEATYAEIESASAEVVLDLISSIWSIRIVEFDPKNTEYVLLKADRDYDIGCITDTEYIMIKFNNDADCVWSELTSQWGDVYELKRWLGQYFMSDVNVDFTIFNYERIIIDSELKMIIPLNEKGGN